MLLKSTPSLLSVTDEALQVDRMPKQYGVTQYQSVRRSAGPKSSYIYGFVVTRQLIFRKAERL
jgi:hypothetical protein